MLLRHGEGKGAKASGLENRDADSYDVKSSVGVWAVDVESKLGGSSWGVAPYLFLYC